jgi:hypothetical protein
MCDFECIESDFARRYSASPSFSAILGGLDLTTRRPDISIQRQPGNADHPADFTDRRFDLPVKVNHRGRLLVAELRPPAARAAPRAHQSRV